MRYKERIVVVSLAVAAPFHAGAARADLTLDELLAPAYPSQLTAAAAADRAVFVLDDRGARNVWTVTGDDEPVRLTAYEADDGLPLGGLALSADGSVAVYVRGGGRNRHGEHPNPTSDPAGAGQTLWAVATAGGEAWSLGEGRSPVIAPDGGSVVFLRDDGLYAAPLAPPAVGTGSGDDPTEEAGAVDARRLFTVRGQIRGPEFSPDGGRLAFVSDRGDHSFIGVFDLADESIVWLAPSFDRDDFPAWSPDGRRVAFIRRDGALKDEIFSFLVSWPFRILVADLAGGATEVWRSSERGGGFAQIYPSEPLRWAADRLVFYSEDDGFMRIYSLAVGASPDTAAPAEPIALTPTGCEAEHSDVDPAGRSLVYSHNCTAIDLRQVARIAVGGGDSIDLAARDGVHSSPVFAADGRFVYMRSAGALTPTGVARMATTGPDYRRVLDPAWPEGFDASGMVEPIQVVLTADDGVEVHGQLFDPWDAADGPRPGLVFLHGGPMRQMLLGWHYIHYYSRCYAFNQYMASRGWVVLSVNFRAGIGYGQDFRLAPRQGPYGASEYQDVLAAGRYLRSLPSVDPDRVALWGGSYGGYLTALGLARDSALFAAGVDLHGVHDWAFRATDFTEGGGWGVAGEEAMQLALESSPSFDVSRWTSPVLLVHGDDDRNVLFQQSTDLAVRLRRQGLEPEVLVLPDEVHGFLRHASWLRVFTAAAEFLERHLGTPRPGPGAATASGAVP